ncbi:uncharacterized protein BJX67DRAFT_108851 [Aspergillus lucknowensis]|uniref:F-box domain-containing protein n=1 Tax=Aspergillus lucknowensis TaxID=176173 RepID=A0ABR4LS88_9EURO
MAPLGRVLHSPARILLTISGQRPRVLPVRAYPCIGTAYPLLGSYIDLYRGAIQIFTQPDTKMSSLLSLPLELRHQIYRHVFSLPTSQSPSPHGPHTKDSIPPEFTTMPNTFLALLSVNRQIHAEAMPLLFAESFFKLDIDIPAITRFLRGIGPRRRKYIRCLGFHFTSKALHELHTNVPNMQILVQECLVYCERIELLELVVPTRMDEGYLLAWGSAAFIRPAGVPSYPKVFLGVEQLEALDSVGELRIVGDLDELLVCEEDRAWFRAFGEGRKPCGLGREGGTTSVVFVDRKAAS